MKPCLVPATHSEDLTNAMATTLRVKGMTFSGSADDIEDRAFKILWRNPTSSGGYFYDDIKKRLTTAIERARELGPINLESADA